jgi:hypothetical protein
LVDEGDAAILVQRHDGGGAGVADHLQLHLRPVGQARPLQAELNQPTPVDDPTRVVQGSGGKVKLPEMASE